MVGVASSCDCDPGNDKVARMEYDKDKVDEMVLALLYLTLHDGNRAWKGHDWDAMDRLHEKGMIGEPAGKAKSVWLTDEGLRRSEKLFMEHFGSAARNTI
jgi:hypothetical protein